MRFAEQLRKAMLERNMSQKELADVTGISRASISQYISGKNEPRDTTIGKIADALDCTTAFLMGEVPDEPTAVDGLKNVTIEQAAKMLGKSKQFVRVALQRGLVPFGFAVKISGDKYSYHISPKKLADYINA